MFYVLGIEVDGMECRGCGLREPVWGSCSSVESVVSAYTDLDHAIGVSVIDSNCKISLNQRKRDHGHTYQEGTAIIRPSLAS